MTLQAAAPAKPIKSATPAATAPTGRYQLLAEVGRGGMGVVYKALDRKLDRTVAIKLLPAEWSRDELARKRFVHEAQAVAAIDHPNICTVHDIGSTRDGQLFIVMAHYEGQTLKSRLNGQEITTPEIIDITMQVASALDAAHACGVVHRDIKPGNIFLCTTGVVKVLDFGIAHRSRLVGTGAEDTDSCSLDVPGRPLGTASYMAPERILDMPVDPRSDIFSLGVVMYEMATGHRPFAGASPGETALKVLDAEPEPMTSCRPSRPRLLDAIVQRALAKDRNDRYQSPAELFNALGELSTQAWRVQQKSHVTRVNDRRGNYGSLRAGGQRQHGLSLCAAK